MRRRSGMFAFPPTEQQLEKARREAMAALLIQLATYVRLGTSV